MPERTAPVQGYPDSIPWSVHAKAWEDYARRFGGSQSAKRIAERGGFSISEMDAFHPTWRDEVEEIPRLREKLAAAEAERASWRRVSEQLEREKITLRARVTALEEGAGQALAWFRCAKDAPAALEVRDKLSALLAQERRDAR